MLLRPDRMRMVGQLEFRTDYGNFLSDFTAVRNRIWYHVSGLQHPVCELSPNSQRGTATSTYLTSWDVGLGIGMLTGGYLAEIATFKIAYLFGASLTVVSLLYFHLKAGPHFEKNRLR